MKATIFLLFSLISVYAVFFSSSCNETANIDIESNWTLISFSAQNMQISDEEISPLPAITMFARAEKNGAKQNAKNQSSSEQVYRIFGFGGVNKYTGNLSLRGKNISIFSLEPAQVPVPENAAKIEACFFSALKAGGDVLISDKDGSTTLSISNAKTGTKLVLKKTFLENTFWELLEYNTGSALVSTPQQGNVNIGFTNDSKLYGTTSVNRFFASYSLNPDGEIRIFDIGLTRMAALNFAAAEFERRQMELFGQSVFFDLSGNILKFKNAKAEILLVYKQI